jgi:hypothetical protein
MIVAPTAKDMDASLLVAIELSGFSCEGGKLARTQISAPSNDFVPVRKPSSLSTLRKYVGLHRFTGKADISVAGS